MGLDVKFPTAKACSSLLSFVGEHSIQPDSNMKEKKREKKREREREEGRKEGRQRERETEKGRVDGKERPMRVILQFM